MTSFILTTSANPSDPQLSLNLSATDRTEAIFEAGKIVKVIDPKYTKYCVYEVAENNEAFLTASFEVSREINFKFKNT